MPRVKGEAKSQINTAQKPFTHSRKLKIHSKPKNIHAAFGLASNQRC